MMGPSTQLVPGEGDTFLDQVKNCAEWDEMVVKALKELGNSGNLQGEEWSEEDGLVQTFYFDLWPQIRI